MQDDALRAQAIHGVLVFAEAFFFDRAVKFPHAPSPPPHYSAGLVRRMAGIRNTHAIATAAAPMSAPAKHTDPMPKAVLTAPPTAEPPPIPRLKMPE